MSSKDIEEIRRQLNGLQTFVVSRDEETVNDIADIQNTLATVKEKLDKLILRKKKYLFTDPNGKQYEVINVSEFAKKHFDNPVSASVTISKITSIGVDQSYNGWTFKVIE